MSYSKIYFRVTIMHILLLLFIGIHTSEARQNSQAEGLSWSINNNVLSITGNGTMPDYTSVTSQPWFKYNSTINSVIIAEGITSIGDYAFATFGNLSSIAIPTTVESIGARAFFNCNNLVQISLSDHITNISDSAFNNQKTIYYLQINN